MPHRSFGSVRELPSGRFQARWTGADGKEHKAPATFIGKTEAREWLSEQETDRRRGAWVDPEKGRSTLEVYAKDWLHGRPDLRPRTRELYDGLLERHILPKLGPVELANIDVAAVRSWRASLLRQDVGQVTVAKSYRLLRTILGTAVEDGRIVANPCKIKGAGVEDTTERPTATVAEVFALADAIEARYRALVLLGSFASLRFGELAALRWKNVDIEKGTVEISESAIELGKGEERHWVVDRPKSKAGTRPVSIPAQVVEELKKHRETFGQHDLVFAGAKGAPLRRGNFYKVWNDARVKVGVPYHFHDLRHTGNTLAAATGASTAELMKRMGHASARAALIYQHATRDRDTAIADALGTMIDQHQNPSRHAQGTKRKRAPRAKAEKGTSTR